MRREGSPHSPCRTYIPHLKHPLSHLCSAIPVNAPLHHIRDEGSPLGGVLGGSSASLLCVRERKSVCERRCVYAPAYYAAK